MMGDLLPETCWAIKKYWNNNKLWQPRTYVRPEAAIIVFELLMMGGVLPETCWAIKKHWNNNKLWQPKTYVRPEAAIIVFELLMMGGVSPETCWAIKKHWNNKFYYTVTSCWFFLWDVMTTLKEISNLLRTRTFSINTSQIRTFNTRKRRELKICTVCFVICEI
jgi:hypothetical protein